jgi:hypothetical protein
VCERSRWLRPNWPDADIQQAMTTREVVLDGGSPWGFRLHGGADLNQPLRISRVSSVAALFLGFVYATITAAIVTITDAMRSTSDGNLFRFYTAALLPTFD